MVVPEDATDEALVSRAALGDNHAFDEITIRYQARVYRLACRLVGQDDAPDVVQEGFLSVYRNLASFRHESQFGTWLYRIVTNAALMHRRARTRRPVESLEEFLPEFDATGSHRHAPAELQVAARADELLDRRFLAEQATAALDRLPDLYRSAFVLRDLEELSTAEVARVLDIEPATVRQRVHRARLMLRGYLSALAGVRIMTDISCRTGVELLMDYLEGVVPEDVRTILDSHVAGCPKCTAFVASYVATPRILRDATAPALPPELQRSLLAFLRAQRGEGPRQKD